ncbi:MAG TPA: DHH family phosphoesterase [Thermoplasmata archaeon]|nr:DHH family phosphoesterase [Thermoplasmata archaeon]
MPSGPEHFVDEPAYSSEFTRAREVLLAHPGRWHLIYHYDGDGIASASSAMRALLRLGYGVQATPLVGVERSRMADLLRGFPGPTLIVDTGATWLDLYAEQPHPVIVLDHHQYPGVPQPPELPPHVAFVNPLDWGVDGMSELCAATLTWLYTIFLDPKNWDNAPWGLSGAIADRQHQGGFRGLNARLLKEATDRSLVVPRRSLGLFGASVGEGVTRSIDPYFRGLSSRPGDTESFLRMMAVDPKKPITSLEPEEEKRLASSLLERLAAQGTRPEFCEMLTQELLWLPSLGLSATELSNYQNAAGRIGEPGVGIALALGDPKALARAREAEESWREGILKGLRRIEDEGVHTLAALQWFESPEAALAGTQAGFAMNYLLDPRRPVFACSKVERLLRVSARGTLHLVDQGLDLAAACRLSAAAVEGEGGGHKVAAGASLPADRWEPFLAEANRLIEAQLPHLREGNA